jgi:hypothetical protein
MSVENFVPRKSPAMGLEYEPAVPEESNQQRGLIPARRSALRVDPDHGQPSD